MLILKAGDALLGSHSPLPKYHMKRKNICCQPCSGWEDGGDACLNDSHLFLQAQGPWLALQVKPIWQRFISGYLIFGCRQNETALAGRQSSIAHKN